LKINVTYENGRKEGHYSLVFFEKSKQLIVTNPRLGALISKTILLLHFHSVIKRHSIMTIIKSIISLCFIGLCTLLTAQNPSTINGSIALTDETLAALTAQHGQDLLKKGLVFEVWSVFYEEFAYETGETTTNVHFNDKLKTANITPSIGQEGGKKAIKFTVSGIPQNGDFVLLYYFNSYPSQLKKFEPDSKLNDGTNRNNLQYATNVEEKLGREVKYGVFSIGANRDYKTEIDTYVMPAGAVAFSFKKGLKKIGKAISTGAAVIWDVTKNVITTDPREAAIAAWKLSKAAADAVVGAVTKDPVLSIPGNKADWGGGGGYSRIVTYSQADLTRTGKGKVFLVSTKKELIDSLGIAEAGQIVYVDDKAEINMTGVSELSIKDGVILASGRGRNGSLGAKLYCIGNGNYNLFKLSGVSKNIRITGLRLQGPDPNEKPVDGIKDRAGCIDITYSKFDDEKLDNDIENLNIEIDNNEMWAWPNACVSVTGVSGVAVRYNWMHHNLRDGGLGKGSAGYGVVINGGHFLVEKNLFNNNRHDIACGGHPLSNYTFKNNLVLKGGSHHSIDVHGWRESNGDRKRPDGTCYAGNNFLIEGNIVLQDFSNVQDLWAYNLLIRGIPMGSVVVRNNQFVQNKKNVIGQAPYGRTVAGSVDNFFDELYSSNKRIVVKNDNVFGGTSRSVLAKLNELGITKNLGIGSGAKLAGTGLVETPQAPPPPKPKNCEDLRREIESLDESLSERRSLDINTRKAILKSIGKLKDQLKQQKCK
jgi:hypothetical protein